MLYLGIDLGGTTIKAGLVEESGKIIGKRTTETQLERGAPLVIADMIALAKQILEEHQLSSSDLAGIGVGVPGIVDPASGMVFRSANLKWERVPLLQMLKEAFSCPVATDNDATAATAAEAVAGVSAGVANSVFITLGTGVGSGIIMNGRLISGVHGVGSEIGHTVIEANGVLCSCGKRGCVNRYCSATALVRMAEEAMEKYENSLLFEKERTAKSIIEAQQRGDTAACEAFDRYTTYLAITISNIVTTLDPELVVLGGGVSGAGEILLAPLRQKLDQMVLFRDLPYAELKIAALGNDAGIIGAAMLVRPEL